jgi:hypothetical protein
VDVDVSTSEDGELRRGDPVIAAERFDACVAVRDGTAVSER